MLKIFFLFLFLTIYGYTIKAQDAKMWNGKKCAVCLTYDDALNVHLDNVVPLLDSLGFTATFYISGSYPGFRERLEDWRVAAAKGNELGNHTLFHPCEGSKPGREWVQPDYDLNNYTLKRLVDEIKVTNELLSAVDGKTERTFAYTCDDRTVEGSSFASEISNDFLALRTTESKMQKIDEVNLQEVGSYVINGNTADELIALVKEAMNKDALLVFLFHGVGGEHPINVSLDAHSKLLHFIKQNEDKIWVSPLVDIAEFIKDYQERNRKD